MIFCRTIDKSCFQTVTSQQRNTLHYHAFMFIPTFIIPRVETKLLFVK